MRQTAKGFAVLSVALLLLAGAALILLFAQKNLLVDLQITRNGYASRVAYAAADSGLAVALTRLNDPEQRKQHLVDTKGRGFYDAVTMPEMRQSLGDRVDARIKLKGLALGGSDIRLQLQSTGCISDCSQGKATVSQSVVLQGGIHQTPYALLSARNSINVTGPVTLNNPVAAVRGMLMHAGGAVTYDEQVNRMSASGINPDRAQVALDQAYAQQNADAFFHQWFGADKTMIRDNATRIHCQGDCASRLATAGSRVVWLEGDATLGSGSLGSTAAPVIIIAAGNLQLSGSVRVTGIVYSMAPVTQIQLGMGAVDGAIIAENQLQVGQGGMLTYSPVVLSRAQSTLGRFVLVPGSWSDGE